MLSDMYVPDIADLSSPTISGSESDEEGEEDFEEEEEEEEAEEEEEVYSDVRSSDGGVASSVDIKTLCLPGRRSSSFDTKNTTCLLSGSLDDRCHAALQHSQAGMASLEMASDHQEQKPDNSEPKIEVQGRAKPFDPIPLHYEPIRKPSPTDMRLAPNVPFRTPWKLTYARLLLKKAAIAAYVLAHSLSGSCNLGTALRYTKLSFLCYGKINVSTDSSR